LRRVRTEKAAYAAALQSYLSESNSIADLLRRAQRGQRVIQGQGGYLKWPVSGRVTSEYGWRTHPVYGYRSFHTGIDVAAPSGTTVKAARAGEVLYVGYKGAFGLIVLIDHGNSVATMYAHLSRSYVSAGDAVSTLGSVGAVGCTGWCTGPHVHFEVRSGGEPQNPRLWL
jgi:murein DD-endopeptidase MepM/ murein hydrolase activator NlpD